MFKLLFRERAAKYEAKDIGYAVLARVIREGGIKVTTAARYSLIPNHCESLSGLHRDTIADKEA